MVFSLESPGSSPLSAGLYVHVPFCETKCGYCDFYSVPLGDRDTATFVHRLCREVHTRVAVDGPNISTIFCGGGTPTLLPDNQLGELLSTLRAAVNMEGVVEFTVEANPATVDVRKATQLAEAGVTRVSMGAQSFFASELEVLERLHSPDDIPPSVEVLRSAGIQRINLDLIFGIPGQTASSWTESLARAVDLGVEHISCYGLTFEPNTALTHRLRRGDIERCDEEFEAELFELTMTTLERSGYEQYEISNYAKPGCVCRHNLKYWRNEPYVGVGPSAAGCIRGRRYKNVADIGRYMRLIDETGTAEAEAEVINQYTLALEMVLMQLRLTEGLCIESYRNRVGEDPRKMLGTPIERLKKLGVLDESPTHIALTRQGKLVANWVMAELAGALDARESSRLTSPSAGRREDISLPVRFINSR